MEKVDFIDIYDEDSETREKLLIAKRELEPEEKKGKSFLIKLSGESVMNIVNI